MGTNQSGQILGAYTNGLMGAISKRNASNEYGYLMKDALGTVRNLVDAEKDIKMTYKYDIFGAIREAVGQDPIGIPQTFTGKELDSDSGLHYFGARYYDSALGRFITADTWTWGPDDERISIGGLSRTALVLMGAFDPVLGCVYVYCGNQAPQLKDINGHLSNAWEMIKGAINMLGAAVAVGPILIYRTDVSSYYAFVLALLAFIWVTGLSEPDWRPVALAALAIIVAIISLPKSTPGGWAIASLAITAAAMITEYICVNTRSSKGPRPRKPGDPPW